MASLSRACTLHGCLGDTDLDGTLFRIADWLVPGFWSVLYHNLGDTCEHHSACAD